MTTVVAELERTEVLQVRINVDQYVEHHRLAFETWRRPGRSPAERTKEAFVKSEIERQAWSFFDPDTASDIQPSPDGVEAEQGDGGISRVSIIGVIPA